MWSTSSTPARNQIPNSTKTADFSSRGIPRLLSCRFTHRTQTQYAVQVYADKIYEDLQLVSEDIHGIFPNERINADSAAYKLTPSNKDGLPASSSAFSDSDINFLATDDTSKASLALLWSCGTQVHDFPRPHISRHDVKCTAIDSGCQSKRLRSSETCDWHKALLKASLKTRVGVPTTSK